MPPKGRLQELMIRPLLAISIENFTCYKLTPLLHTSPTPSCVEETVTTAQKGKYRNEAHTPHKTCFRLHGVEPRCSR